MTNNNKILDKMWDNAPIDITQGTKFIVKSCILQNLFIFVFFVILFISNICGEMKRHESHQSI